MDLAEIIVSIVGIAAIGFVLWWFFGKREAVAARAALPAGPQEVDILVKGGYSPDRIVVRRGQLVRLKFRREETSSCSEKVVFSDFGIVRDLPAHETTAVEFTPDRSGEFTFTCGMNMLRGQIVVEG